MSALLSLVDFEFSYEPAVPGAWRLSIPSFELHRGQVAVVSGDNMSGKSTLLSILGGMVSLRSCTGSVLGFTASEESQAQLAANSVVLSSDDKMFPELSVRQNIIIANRSLPFRSIGREINASRAVFVASGVTSEAAFDAPLGSLSSGGRALAKLARAHLSLSPIVIVDEISSFLDEARAKYFLTSAVKLVQNGRAVIIVSHSDRDRQQLLRESQTVCFHIYRRESRSELTRLDK